MQISFLKDLATLRDPRSQFTFLNFLHSQGRLVEFINLGTFLPSRAEYEEYLCWAASFFDNVVQYNSEVVSISPDAPRMENTEEKEQPVKTFSVTSRDARTGNLRVHTARHVILAIGGQPSIPKCLPTGHSRVIHSSQYAHVVQKILANPMAPYRVAVIGAGQSAAEIFSNIQTLFPNSRTWLVMKAEFLRPSDDSPLYAIHSVRSGCQLIVLTPWARSVNSIFNPAFVDWLYPRSSHYRNRLLNDAKSTNYSVVRLELIERLYETMYDQRRVLGSDEKKWPHRIMGGRHLLGAESADDSGSSLKLRLGQVMNENDYLDSSSAGSQFADAEEVLEVDLVIAATGYKRTAHIDMLADVLHGRSRASYEEMYAVKSCNWPASPISESSDLTGHGTLEVGRNYRVKFPTTEVAADAGIWLQGCCERTHGVSINATEASAGPLLLMEPLQLSDTLLSVLSTRAGEVVASIFGSDARGNTATAQNGS